MEKQTLAILGAGKVAEELVICKKNSGVLWNWPMKVLATKRRWQTLGGQTLEVREVKPEEFDGVSILLAAGGEDKKESELWVEAAVQRRVTVIDNSAVFRLHPEVPLVVPEINPEDLEWHKGVIANPNCSTIQMVMALWPIHRVNPIKEVVVDTYQAVSGSGRAGEEELKNQTRLIVEREKAKETLNLPKDFLGDPSRVKPEEITFYPRQIAGNLFPHIGKPNEQGYTEEEVKMIAETRKIFKDDSIAIAPTCVRVPVRNGHSEAITLTTEKEIRAKEVKEILAQAAGVKVVDGFDLERGSLIYPTPLDDADGKDPVYVGRIREHPTKKNTLLLWVVADNIRKGAALNAIQIAEKLVEMDLLKRTKTLKPEELFRVKNRKE